MIDYLLQFSWSKNGKTTCDESYIKKLKGNKLKGIYKAVVESKNLGSVKEINLDRLPTNIELMTWGFPCTDISNMGEQKGLKKKSGTKSSLVWRGIEILKKKKPTFSIIENVDALVSKKFKEDFYCLLSEMRKSGYNNYWKVINSKNYNVPQNRNRVFIISIRKDKDNKTFKFPKSKRLNKCMGDFLLDNPNKKYFLSNKAKKRYEEKDQKEILERKSREIEVYIKDNFRKTIYQTQGISPTIIESHGDVVKILDKKRLRKLTPLECFRLMGFEDEDYFKAKQAMEKVFYNGNDRSDSRMYKMAGNSIVVPVLESIFKELFGLKGDDNN